MSFNGFVFNLINDLKVTVNMGGARKRPVSSAGQVVRGMVAWGLIVCLALILAGLALAGATSAIEHPALKSVISGLIGMGLLPGMVLFFVYAAMNGGER